MTVKKIGVNKITEKTKAVAIEFEDGTFASFSLKQNEITKLWEYNPLIPIQLSHITAANHIKDGESFIHEVLNDPSVRLEQIF
ncbi:hypothetical protein D1B33_04850 [Lysinibacillus yapensis]|uniref:Uncharacterized protein n=1 Tax=Ureibacillus yapensis TaxID=2304605 RepID=A0A396SQ21_9BACL|nr:hypothetical protein [Lysinibacillus yapensis]RHW38219.1 hypothetical protein D1B33_04850 [Lysinibacillus yapensis]